MTTTRSVEAPVDVALDAPADARSFRDVFDELAPFVWRLLRRLGVPEADVEDACQEVFLVVHRRLPEFDGLRASYKTWVFRIALRVASDARRRVAARREAATSELPEIPVAPPQEGELDAKDRLRLLDTLLAKLGDDAREVLLLHDVEGLAMSEVVLVVGCPLQTGYSRLHAARRDLEAHWQRARARKEVL